MTQPNLGTVSKEERDQFYTTVKCIPTSCEKALRLPRVNWLKQCNAAKPFRNAIELGCYDGFSTRWLLNSPHLDRLIGVELCKEAVEHADRLKKDKIFPDLGTYYCEDIFAFEGGHLDVEPGEHDAVVCFELLEHFPPEESRRLLRLCHSLLSDDGRVFLTTPHIDGPFGKDNPDHTHIHFFNEEKLADWIKQETGCFATVVNIQGILHALWRKDSTDGSEEDKHPQEEAQDNEGPGDSSQGSEDPEGRDSQREALVGEAEKILRSLGRGSKAGPSGEATLTVRQLRDIKPPTLAELEALPETTEIETPLIEDSPLSIEQRLEALEAVAHAPVLTYTKGTLNSIHAKLLSRIEQLDARIRELESSKEE